MRILVIFALNTSTAAQVLFKVEEDYKYSENTLCVHSLCLIPIYSSE